MRLEFCVSVLLTVWALSQEGSLVKFVAYHVAEAAGIRHDAFAVYRHKVQELIGPDGRLIREFVEHASERERYLYLRDAVRTARIHQVKLIVGGVNLEHLTNDYFDYRDNICIVNVPSINRHEIQQLLRQVPPKEQKLHKRSNHSRATKIGLEKARLQGVALGNPGARLLQPKASRAASTTAEEFRAKLRIRILEHHLEGLSLREIAEKLNDGRIPSARGRSWHASSVRRTSRRQRESPK